PPSRAARARRDLRAAGRRRAARAGTRVRRRRAVLRHVDCWGRETMNRCEGRVALVTGGSRGMGAATVRRLHAEGAAVVVADILDDDGKALADELGDRV